MGNNTYAIRVSFKNGIVTTFNNIIDHEEKDGKLYVKCIREIDFPLDNIESIEKVDNREDD